MHYRHNTEPQVRLRYSSQGTDSNLVSMQRSSSLPASSHIIPSSLRPGHHSTNPSSRASAHLEYPTQEETSPSISQEREQEQSTLDLPGGKTHLDLISSLHIFLFLNKIPSIRPRKLNTSDFLQFQIILVLKKDL